MGLARIRSLLLLSLAGFHASGAFVVAPSTARGGATATAATGLTLAPERYAMLLTADPAASVAPSVLLSFDFAAASKVVILGTLGIVTFFTLFTYFTVNVLMPAASKQVEELTKSVDPALWDEYIARLGPGETMATRPDLVQELGQRVLQLQDEQFQRAQAAQAARAAADTAATDPAKAVMDSATAAAIDVEVDTGTVEPLPPATTRSEAPPVEVRISDPNQWSD